MKKSLLIALTLLTNFVFAQTQFSDYYDASSANRSEFSYNITVRIQKTTGATAYDTRYTATLIQASPDSKGYYNANRDNKFYTCSQLGNVCNPNNFHRISVRLSYTCNGQQKAAVVGFKNLNDVQQISVVGGAGGKFCEPIDFNMNVMGAELSPTHLGKILDKINQTGITNTSQNNSENNSNNPVTQTGTTNTGNQTENTTAKPLDNYDPNTGLYTNPMTNNNPQPTSSNSTIEAVGQIATTLTPMIQNFADKREKAYNERKLKEEQKKDETRTNVIKNASDNVKLYEQKAETGDVKAMVATGTSYCYTNTAKFYYWLKKAAALNNADAYFSLYANDPGSDPLKPFYKDKTVEQINWLLQAAQLGHSLSMESLWTVVYGMKKSGHYNPDKAFEWLIKASENGHPESMFWLGKFYEEGKLEGSFSIKNAKNPAKAIETYEALSKLNDGEFKPGALYAIANMYEEGRGVKKDKVKAANYLAQAETLKIQRGEVFYIYGYGNVDDVHFITPFYRCYSAYGKRSQEGAEAREILKDSITKSMTEKSKSIVFVYVSPIVAKNDSEANHSYEYELEKEISEHGSVRILNSLVFSFDRRPDPSSLEKGVSTPIKAGW